MITRFQARWGIRASLVAGAAITVVAASFIAVAGASAEDRAVPNRSAEGLYVVPQGPLAGDRVDLQGRYKSFVYATRSEEGGDVQVDCADELPAFEVEEGAQ